MSSIAFGRTHVRSAWSGKLVHSDDDARVVLAAGVRHPAQRRTAP